LKLDIRWFILYNIVTFVRYKIDIIHIFEVFLTVSIRHSVPNIWNVDNIYKYLKKQ